ncbi:hypothetical protein B0H34DRAFT_671600 [Crassisporium funariophilum]|nr:hypothetical protein B0H34DRAFT_671600 [Crassisporium funariophilum]
MPPKCSIWQKQQSLNNSHQMNTHHTSKSATALPNTLLHHEVQKLTGKLTREQIKRSDLASRLRNTEKREAQAKNANADLREQRRRTLHTAHIQKSRAVTQKENAIQKALNHARLLPKEIYLKEKGVVKEEFQVALRELASCNVPVKKIGIVLEKALEASGIVIKDSISARTVAWTVKVGGVVSDIQLAYEIKESKGITLLGDGTNICHLNVESQHGSWEAQDYSGQLEGKHQVVCTFRISMAVDHTSETQFHSWKRRGAEFIATYNASELGKKNPTDVWMFAAAITGLMTDHAADQKKRFMKDAAVEDLLPVIIEENTKKIECAGGIGAWNTLPEDKQQHRDAETCKILCARFGETVWKEFSDEKRRLMNQANAAAAGAGPSKAQTNAVEALQAGAVKLTSLAGAVFQNKDDKKEPSLLLAADTSFETATLNGENWVRPEVFYAVQRIAPQLRHLTGCLVAFFEGALDAWNRFSKEGKQCVFIPATNDANKGLLGQRRRVMRQAPNTTVSYFNARTKYKMNDTKNFMQAKLGAADLAQALHDQGVVATKRARDAEVTRRKDEFERKIDAVVPVLDVDVLKAKLHSRTFTNSLIIQQVDWHWRYNERDDKLTHLIVLVEAYNKLPKPVLRINAAGGSTHQLNNIPVQPDWEDREAAEEDNGASVMEG